MLFGEQRYSPTHHWPHMLSLLQRKRQHVTTAKINLASLQLAIVEDGTIFQNPPDPPKPPVADEETVERLGTITFGAVGRELPDAAVTVEWVGGATTEEPVGNMCENKGQALALME
jgi:hypothetical protein